MVNCVSLDSLTWSEYYYYYILTHLILIETLKWKFETIDYISVVVLLTRQDVEASLKARLFGM